MSEVIAERVARGSTRHWRRGGGLRPSTYVRALEEPIVDPETVEAAEVTETSEAATPRRRMGERSAMGDVLRRIGQAYDSCDYAAAAQLLERELLTAWFGFETDRFAEIITTLVCEGQANGLLELMAQFLGVPDQAPLGTVEIESPASEPAVAEQATPLSAAFSPAGFGIGGFGAASFALTEDLRRTSFAISTRCLDLRFQGRMREALELSGGLQRATGQLHPLFDSHGGWLLFSAVQHGITAMLAGRFGEALSSFAKAQSHVLVPSLAFLTRDALLRAAVIHAIYGEPAQARELLQRASQVPRTESWVEPLIDASRDLLVALLDTDDLEVSLRLLEAIPQQAMGELWPFHVVAVQRVLIGLGRFDDARGYLDTVEALPLPCIDGDGFSGSAVPLCQAMLHMMAADFPGARRQLERVDRTLAISRLVSGVLQLMTGQPREALRLMVGMHVETRELRIMSVWRHAVISGAYHLLGEVDDCRVTLEYAMRHHLGGVQPGELKWFSEGVRRFAEAEIDGWPASVDAEGMGPYGTITVPEVLTQRELEVLRSLASGQSREEIARSHFISIHTVKVHLRSVYRKLAVSSRTAAVVEAERLGLV